MDVNKIKAVDELHNEIDNFRECYRGEELWGFVDHPVQYEDLLSFLINNPHFQEIADKINKLELALNKAV